MNFLHRIRMAVIDIWSSWAKDRLIVKFRGMVSIPGGFIGLGSN